MSNPEADPWGSGSLPFETPEGWEWLRTPACLEWLDSEEWTRAQLKLKNSIPWIDWLASYDGDQWSREHPKRVWSCVHVLLGRLWSMEPSLRDSYAERLFSTEAGRLYLSRQRGREYPKFMDPRWRPLVSRMNRPATQS